MSTEPSEPLYNGIFRHGVDEKRRLQVPARWRPEAAGTEFTIIFWPKASQGACLRVLPPAQMNKLRAEINALSNDDPRKVTMKRFIGSSSAQATIDKAGRICLPEEMAAKADIDINSEAVVVGLLDRFEIWNSKRYVKVEEADAVVAADAFKMME